MSNEGAHLIAKARRAEASARLLLQAGDVDGACSRAYYAMFDAARAALMSEGLPRESLKSHSSVISGFGLHFVKPGQVPKIIGKAINDVHEMRLVADYLPDAVPPDRADWAVRQASLFMEAVLALPSVRAFLAG